MFKVGHIYTHKHMLDACILVVHVYEAYTTKDENIKVRWFHKSGRMLSDVVDQIRIKEEDVEGWVEC